MALATILYPRMKLVVSGQSLVTESIEVKQNGYYNADRVRASVPLWGNGLLDDEAWNILGADGSDVSVQVYSGQADVTGAVTWASSPLFDGLLLDKDVSYDQGTVEIDCIDYTQKLINYKLYQAYANQSGEEVINSLVGQVGMTAQVDSSASGLLGEMYSRDHMKVHNGQFTKQTTAWDLITYIAKTAGCVAFVKGKVLYVQPNQPNQGQAWQIRWSKPTTINGVTIYPSAWNVKTLRLKHNLLAAKDITVTATGFHSKHGKSYTASARSGPVKNGGNANQSQYVIGPYPNCTTDQLQQLANAAYRDLTIHEYTLETSAQADFTVSPYRTITVANATGTLAQTFWVNEISFMVHQNQGASMSIRAKNHTEVNNTNP